MTDAVRDKEIEDDFDAGRQNYHFLLTKILDDLEKISAVASDTEHPRAFEVLAGMYKTAADMNDKLMEHQRKKQVIDSDRKKTGAQDVIPDQAYLGSTVDLQRKLIADKKEQKRKQLEEIEDAEIIDDVKDPPEEEETDVKDEINVESESTGT